MGTDPEQPRQWRHLLPIPGVDQDHVEAPRPLRVVVDLDPSLTLTVGVQRLVWLLVTLLTRSTSSVIGSVGLSIDDGPLHAGVDPAEPDGGPSLLAALRS